jgi:hypothetical protein
VRLRWRGFGAHDEIHRRRGALIAPRTSELGHLRVSNAIPGVPQDLDRFIADRRRVGPTGGRGGRQ